MNKAKQVSNFLICGTYSLVEHYGKRIKILHDPGVLLRADLTGHGQFSQSANFCQKRMEWPCLQKDAHAGFQLFFHNVLLYSQHHISKNWRPILLFYFSGLSHSVLCNELQFQTAVQCSIRACADFNCIMPATLVYQSLHKAANSRTDLQNSVS